jgi:MFS family permease
MLLLDSNYNIGMLRGIRTVIFKDQLWINVLTLSLVIFFIFLGDAILSFWVPGFIERTLSSSIAMGFVMSFSSIVGLGVDLALPQIIRGITVKKLLILGIITSLVFSTLLISSTIKPLIFILLLAMALWGLYYEFLGFAGQQFVADVVPLKLHSASWAVIGTFKNLAYFLGPIIAGWILLKGDKMPPLVAIFFVLIGLLILNLSGKRHERRLDFDLEEVNFFRELEHWSILFKRVWPVIVMSIFMGLIDSFFWTIGAIYSEKLSQISWLGGMFLPFYTLPSLFMGFVVAKWSIYEGKKKLAERLLLVSGLVLSLLIFFENVAILVFIVFLASLFLAIVYPLVDGVYSDIVARMGRERRHMIGLCNSTMSLAYVVGPIMAGLIANFVGEKMSFVVIGVLTAFISGILLLSTPRKLKLPHKVIENWE